ncbi:MAG: hypothetical protein CMH36_08715 [Microbacterium sp.]|uniref:hypothetical protein n=1 Tax=uncultured Microbacterium sp. TaxID=191216 RepID=UPI000C8E66D7|nr:hypothetical protein [Microbacterium bovistercoris]MAL06893.1 hypothetical protein [Microbacterium sp.]MBN9208027.1 hypothetical protein [Microbacterium ginsengisoli]
MVVDADRAVQQMVPSSAFGARAIERSRRVPPSRRRRDEWRRLRRTAAHTFDRVQSKIAFAETIDELDLPQP